MLELRGERQVLCAPMKMLYALTCSFLPHMLHGEVLAVLKLDSWEQCYRFAPAPGHVAQAGPSEAGECLELQFRLCSLGHHAFNQSRLVS